MDASNATSRLSDDELAKALSAIYYTDGGFGGAASLHQKLRATGAGTASLSRVKAWIATQQVGAYLQDKPKPAVYARFTEQRPNRIHQADVLFLPHDKVGPRTYKYALTLVDVASRYKAARPLTEKTAEAVTEALRSIYGSKDTPLKWPHTMMVDQGGEFRGTTQTLLAQHEVTVRRADKGHHRSQAFVESFNRVLAERLFRGMYAKGFDDGQPSNAWVKALPVVVADINATTTRLTGIPPEEAIGRERVPLRPRQDRRRTAPLTAEPRIAVGAMVHVVANEEASNVDAKRRATDPYWTARAYPIVKRIDAPNEPSLYYVEGRGAHGFTRPQLRVATGTADPRRPSSSADAAPAPGSQQTAPPALPSRSPLSTPRPPKPAPASRSQRTAPPKPAPPAPPPELGLGVATRSGRTVKRPARFDD